MQTETCAVSTAMLDDINAQEASCKATVERAQDRLKRLNLDAEVAKHQTALDELQRRASALRQVADLGSCLTKVLHQSGNPHLEAKFSSNVNCL